MMAASIHSAKSALRKALKDRLSQLTEREKVLQSEIVTDKLLMMPQYQKSQRVSLFLSMKDEIQTNKIMEDLLSSSKHCFIPQYSKDNMKMVRLNSMEDFENLPETKWKIKQPALNEDREDALDTGGLDLILMPGLGFTKQGFRLGRGRGYYDNYLRHCRQRGCNPVTIALAFAEQLIDNVPMTETDIPVDVVLYPEDWEMIRTDINKT